MPHQRNRYLRKQLEKALRWSPTVSLLGMRRVGKTTLLRQLCESYVTLDDESTSGRFHAGDWSALESHSPPLAVDECQKAPALFDRIKLLVDRKPKPGQYILTGSVRFLSKRQIRESLTGRTAILELLPMTLAESHELPQSEFIATLLDLTPSKLVPFLNSLQNRRSRFTAQQCLSYLRVGGLPGIAFKRDSSVRRDLWNSQLETLLSRDIQQLYPTEINFQKLRTLFSEVARQQSFPFNHSQLARKIGVSAPTIKRLLAAFEGLFLIRSVGKAYYCEDQGMASHVLGAPEDQVSIFHLRRLVFQELFAQLSYQYRGAFTLTNYLTRGGVDIPFVLTDTEKNRSLAIVVDDSNGASDKSLKSLTWFKKRHPKPSFLWCCIAEARSIKRLQARFACRLSGCFDSKNRNRATSLFGSSLLRCTWTTNSAQTQFSRQVYWGNCRHHSTAANYRERVQSPPHRRVGRPVSSCSGGPRQWSVGLCFHAAMAPLSSEGKGSTDLFASKSSGLEMNVAMR